MTPAHTVSPGSAGHADRLAETLAAAKAQGVLPADAVAPGDEGRPWPVVLLTGLGAWLAAVPLLGVVGLLLGELITSGPGPYFCGALILAGSAVVLRSAGLPVFVEQLATPGLLVGAGTLGFGLYRDLPLQAASFVLLLVAAGLAFMIPRAWLRVLLGASAACLLVVTLSPPRLFEGGGDPVSLLWLVLHAALALWLGALVLQRRAWNDGATARQAAALESFAAGWAVALLAGLAWFAGSTFLVGGVTGAGVVGGLARELGPGSRSQWASLLPQAGSVLLALAAAGWTARRWPALREPLAAAAGLGALVLAWFLASLGAVLLMLAVLLTSGRLRLAAAAATALAWIVGSFYYLLDWPLATKATVLVAVAALLGGLAWLARSRAANGENRTPASASASPGRSGLLVALAAAATLGVANFAIWQKEDLVARGQPIFVELAPVDPRSLMQGDYMRLNFNVPPDLEKAIDELDTRRRPHVVARRDARGVATLLRLARGEAPLGEGEFRVELTPKDGRWIFVSDAWFFREGDAALWEKAKYGEFRVLPNGAALLVGMADAELRPIGR